MNSEQTARYVGMRPAPEPLDIVVKLPGRRKLRFHMLEQDDLGVFPMLAVHYTHDHGSRRVFCLWRYGIEVFPFSRRPRSLTRRTARLLNPRSSESFIPLLQLDGKLKAGLFCQWGTPFGLYIRLPFMFARWGSA